MNVTIFCIIITALVGSLTSGYLYEQRQKRIITEMNAQCNEKIIQALETKRLFRRD